MFTRANATQFMNAEPPNAEQFGRFTLVRDLQFVKQELPTSVAGESTLTSPLL
jgi:hypothetical protein